MATPLETWAACMVGVPFKDKGRDRNGLDCWGLVRLAYLEVYGLEEPSFAECYASTKDHEAIATVVEAQSALWHHIPKENLRAVQPGDVIKLRIDNRPIHVGLVLGRGSFLHATEDFGVCKGEYLEIGWRRRVLGFYRPVALELPAWA